MSPIIKLLIRIIFSSPIILYIFFLRNLILNFLKPFGDKYILSLIIFNILRLFNEEIILSLILKGKF